MSEETINPITQPEPEQTAPAPAQTPAQLELPRIQAMIREAIAEATAELHAARPEPQVPAGGNTPYVLDADALPTAEKIRRGLAMRSNR